MNENKHDNMYILTEKAYQDYIHFVKDNINEKFSISELKLNRNIRAGEFLRTTRTNISVYGFGFLRIGVRDGHIIFVDNYVSPAANIDRELKSRLDIEWGLIKEEEIDPKYEGVTILHKLMGWFKLHN